MKKTQFIARFALLVSIVLILWLALSPSPPGTGWSDKVNHTLAFFVLAGLLDYATVETASFNRKAVALLCFGFSIEAFQFLTGYRYFEVGDLIADCSGMLIYLVMRRYLRPTIDKLCLTYIG
jgi:VanZ family protein